MLRNLFGKMFGGKTRAADPFLTPILPPRMDSASAILADPYQNHPYVNAAIRLISQGISQVPLKIYSGTDSNPTEITQGKWYDLFLRPNPAMTGVDLIEATLVLMAVSPDCFWVLEGRGDGFIEPNETPLQIWPVSGSNVQEVLSSDQQKLLGWRISTSAGTVVYPPHAVVQHKWQYNPSNPWRGSTPLVAARAAIRMDAKANRFNEDSFDNNGIVGTTIEFPENVELDQQQKEDLRKDFEARHVGWGKAKRVLVISHGGKVNNQASSHTDLQYIEQKKITKDEIANVLGVPAMFLGGDAQNLPYASAVAIRRVFYENTLIPLMRKIERSCEAQLFAGRSTLEERGRAIVNNNGRAMWCAFDMLSIAALLQDMTDRLDQARKAQDLGVPLNVCIERFDLGIKPQEGGDIPLIKVGLIPLDMAALGGGIAGLTGQGVPGSAPIAPAPTKPPAAPPAPATPEAPQEKAATPPAVRSESKDRSQERAEVLRAVQTKAMLPLQRKMESALKGLWQRMLQDALAGVAKLPGDRANPDATKALDELLASLEGRFDKKLIERMTPLFKEGVEIGAKTVDSQIGLKTFTTESPSVLDFLKAKELRLKGVNATVLDSLRTTLVEGIEATENLEALQDRVRETLKSTSARALVVARTEAAQTVNGSRQLAMAAEGVAKTEWISAKDSHVRGTHTALDGLVVGLGEKFPNNCAYPGDIGGPAKEVINCRCVSSPVID